MPCPTIHDVPVDLWLLIMARAKQRDVASVAQTCRDLSEKMRQVTEHRGIRLAHGREHALAAFPGVRCVEILRRLSALSAMSPPLPLRLVPLHRLERLTLRHPVYPPDARFWPGVMAGCPRLRHVAVCGHFTLDSYAAGVRHHVDLLRSGADRLESVNLEGNWLVYHPHYILNTPLWDIEHAIKAMECAVPVPAGRLTSCRMACWQTPIPLDAPLLRVLEIDENPDARRTPSLAARMGPLTQAGVTTLKWTHHWPWVTPKDLSGYAALERLDLGILSATSVWRMNQSLATLSLLPARLRHLTLRLEPRLMCGLGDDNLAWGNVLSHMADLETLVVCMRCAPNTVCTLLEEWMGAPRPRLVRAEFDEPASKWYEDDLRELLEEEGACSEDETVQELAGLVVQASGRIGDAGVRAWLDSHPGSVMEVRGLDRLRCPHPRFISV